LTAPACSKSKSYVISLFASIPRTEYRFKCFSKSGDSTCNQLSGCSRAVTKLRPLLGGLDYSRLADDIGRQYWHQGCESQPKGPLVPESNTGSWFARLASIGSHILRPNPHTPPGCALYRQEVPSSQYRVPSKDAVRVFPGQRSQ